LSTLPETQSWITSTLENPKSLIYTVSLLSASSPEVIGVVGLNRFERLLYIFHPDYWGKGYATEALKGFQKRLAEVQPERVLLVAAVHEGNDKSENVLGKCGFLKVAGIPFVGARSLTEEEEKELRITLVKTRELNVSESGGQKDIPSTGDFAWFCSESLGKVEKV
jgi:Acetyltransferase (GNAT) domain